MEKVKLLNWDDICKKIKLKSSAEEVQLKSANALFSRLLVIRLSERHIDLQNTIFDYELNAINPVLVNQMARCYHALTKVNLSMRWRTL